MVGKTVKGITVCPSPRGRASRVWPNSEKRFRDSSPNTTASREPARRDHARECMVRTGRTSSNLGRQPDPPGTSHSRARLGAAPVRTTVSRPWSRRWYSPRNVRISLLGKSSSSRAESPFLGVGSARGKGAVVVSQRWMNTSLFQVVAAATVLPSGEKVR